MWSDDLACLMSLRGVLAAALKMHWQAASCFNAVPLSVFDTWLFISDQEIGVSKMRPVFSRVQSMERIRCTPYSVRRAPVESPRA
jgi:hypothetical protein